MAKKRRKTEEKTGVLFLLPLFLILAVIPLIVYMEVVYLTDSEIKNWYGGNTYADFFNFFKSQWFLIFTLSAVVVFGVKLFTKKLVIKRNVFYIAAGIYSVFVILSTLLSSDETIPSRGYVGRFEGVWVLLCYMLVLFITYNFVNNERQIRFVLFGVLFSASFICIIGVFQFVGLDLFRTTFGKMLVLPAAYQQSAQDITFKFDANLIYATLSNSNYVGSFVALVSPIVFFLFMYLKKPLYKAGMGLLFVLLVINLIGSRSSAGMVGFAVAILLTLVLFWRKIFEHKWLSLGAVAGLIAAVVIANAVTQGALTQRVFSELGVTTSIESKKLVVKDIVLDGSRASIVGVNETFTVKLEEGMLTFLSTEGTGLEAVGDLSKSGEAITFTDARYSNYSVKLVETILNVQRGAQSINFRLAPDSIKLVGISGDETASIEDAEAWGFEGYEKLGSARGYIWSRTLPLLKQTLLVGFGPDTFTLHFPQTDYIGKLNAYDTAQIVVDKPHNMYLQVGVNTGCISLIALLVLFGVYIISSMKLFIRLDEKSVITFAGMGIFVGIVGYLTAGFFNDSSVGVTSLFWILLGLGFSCNWLVKKATSSVVSKA